MYRGLSEDEAASRLKQHGFNDIEEKKRNPLLELVSRFAQPTSLMMELALLFSILTGRAYDAYSIAFLLVMNVGISFYHEYRSENAIEKLREKLAIQTKVIRDGKEQRIDSKLIVPGDCVILERGNIVPADAKVLESENLTLDESMLTGESFPKEKREGQTLYSTSIVKTGKVICEVTGTGNRTFFGHTIKLIETGAKQSIIEKDVINIAKFLMAAGVFTMVVLTISLLYQNKSLLDLAELDVSIAIASFPVALPTVIALVTSISVYNLSKKQIIVRRISSIEDLSNVNLLLSDKTGTLTENEISIARVIPFQGTEQSVLKLAYACSDEQSEDLIDAAVIMKAKEMKIRKDFTIDSYTPATSETKRAESKARIKGKPVYIIKGAPQVVAASCALTAQQKKELAKDVEDYAKQGYRVIAVAHKQGKRCRFDGILLLLDLPREEAKGSIRFLAEHGITTKMLTGDNSFIGKKIGEIVGVGTRVITRAGLSKISLDLFGKYDVFAELYPEDKYNLVKAAKQRYVVAVTGDGVNDIPAIKEADIGIAVSTATDATKGACDVALLSPGISVIKDALLESREIFEKVRYYTIYRISESLRIILTILVIGLWIKDYPLTPLQIILLSVLNDIPIISIAFDRVQIPKIPAKLNFGRRTGIASSLGLVGIINSVLFVWLALNVFHLDVSHIETAFFLKLSIGGHLLLLVARTKDRWFKFLPSKILTATILGTQLVATMLAYFGILMPALPLPMILFMWGYAFFWMQVSDQVKLLTSRESSSFA